MAYLCIDLTSELKTSTAIAELERKMVKLMFWVYLILALLTFTKWSEARPLDPFVEALNPNKSWQPMLLGAKAIVNMGLELKVTKKR